MILDEGCFHVEADSMGQLVRVIGRKAMVSRKLKRARDVWLWSRSILRFD